ncbi:HLH-domain-containing protein [Lichtheimia hyalospora FSU 10163]|nr:HLH-domain-containing protein [Lichtheimia hyalospora FSU 10163]
MSSSTRDPLSTANTTPKPSARLINPTTYHLQQQDSQYQMRFKDQVGIDPTQVMEHQHLFFAQHHQDNSPSLSDLDYSDLTTNTPSNGNGNGIITDNHQQSQQSQHQHHYVQHDTHMYNPDQHHHQSPGVVDPSNTTMTIPPPPSGTTRSINSRDSQIGNKLQHPPEHLYSNSVMYYQPSTSSAMSSQSYYYKQIHHSNGVAATTSFGASAPAHLGYNHMHPQPLVGHSVTPNDTAAVAMAVPAPPDSVITGMNRQHHPHVYEQQQQSGTPSTTMDAGSNDINEPYEDDFEAQANLQAIMEKRRRRRESHNAVERRRRDNINDRIHELGQMLPEAMTTEEGGIGRLNKGTILRKSVEQIKLLQTDLQNYQQRVIELEETLHRLTSTNKVQPNTRVSQ